MIVLGSGGHTGEMLIETKKLDLKKFSSVIYVHSHNDDNSRQKILNKIIGEDPSLNKRILLQQIFRSRNIGQSFKSSIITTLLAFFHSLYIILKFRPNIVSFFI